MSDDNIVQFPGLTTDEIPAERVLRAALDANLDNVIVIGREADGTMYFAASNPDAAEIHWLLARAQQQLMDATNG